jgi:predicted DCC family thiol-disulfide oxidoreductase YuxK
MMEEKGLNIILFDENCNLCNSSVSFVKKRDKQETFRFVPLQSAIGKDMLRIFGYADSQIDTFVYLEDCKPFLRSTAGLRVLKELGWPWKIFYVFIIIPKPIRDFFYSLIAKYRFRWFGTKAVCELPNS